MVGLILASQDTATPGYYKELKLPCSKGITALALDLARTDERC